MRKRQVPLIALALCTAVVGFTAIGAAAPKAKSILNVYTYDSFPPDLMKMVKEDMLKTNAVDVKFRTFEDTGVMYSALIQEKTKPVADVVVGLDNIYVEQAKKDGLFRAYKPKSVAKIGADLVLDKDYFLTPFDYGAITFNYDSERLKKAPHTWADITSEEYKGKIVIENPLTSSPGQALLFASIAQFGEDGYLDFWKKLKPNLLTMAPGWSAAYGMFTNGEAPIVLSYGTSPVYHLMYEKTERYKAILLDDSAWLQVEGVGITAKAKDVQDAQRLIDYMLDTKFQTALQETQFMYPVRSDVPLSSNFRVAVKPKVVLNGRLSTKQIAAKRDKWLKDWESAMNTSK